MGVTTSRPSDTGGRIPSRLGSWQDLGAAGRCLRRELLELDSDLGYCEKGCCCLVVERDRSETLHKKRSSFKPHQSWRSLHKQDVGQPISSGKGNTLIAYHSQIEPQLEPSFSPEDSFDASLMLFHGLCRSGSSSPGLRQLMHELCYLGQPFC